MPGNTKNQLPIEVRELIYEMLQGKRKGVLKDRLGKKTVSPILAATLIKAELNYNITPHQVSDAKERYYKQEFIPGQNIKVKRPRWSASETKRCKELYLKLPSMSDPETWQKNILDILDEEFPVRIHTRSGVNNRMKRVNVIRTNTHQVSTNIKSFDDFNAKFLEGGLELISHETGSQIWVVKCLICGRKSKKTMTHSADHGCSGCAEDADTPSNLYETPVYSEIENRWTLKFGESMDPMGKRIPSFGTTRAGKIWTYELYPQLTKYTVNVIERKIEEKFGLYKDPIPELIGNGHTECYHMSKRDLIIEYADQLVLDAKSEIPSK